jgi:poly(3-hydroxybutyrate) depolymerase
VVAPGQEAVDQSVHLNSMRSEIIEGRSGQLPYLLSVPEAEPAGATRSPVLCFLHGYDEGPPTSLVDGMTRHGPLAPSSSPLAREAFIVVAPQMPVRGDMWYRYGREVRRLVDKVQEQYLGDPARTFLTGFSFGGNGVLDLALEAPGPWAALWAVDPTRPPERGPERRVWLSSGAISRLQRDEFIGRLALEHEGNGEPGDRVYEDQGADHVGTARRAYDNDRVYRWLLG